MTDSMDDAGAGEASQEIFDSLLGEILDEVESGGLPDREDLRRRYPGSDAIIDKLIRAATQYHAMIDPPESRVIASPLLDPGTVVGDFEIDSFLARGGMGTVYRAKQLSLGGRSVALKVLPRASMADHVEESFRREALAAAKLHHPRMAEVYGFGTTEDLLFYAMRLVEGPTLQEILGHLAGEPLARENEAIRRRIVIRIAEVASALALVHRAGLVHRDVKPGNIILEGGAGEGLALLDQPAILVDFGLIRQIDTMPESGTRTTSATPAYAPPELLLGKEVDARADVFSLGATLHDLLAGRVPQERLQASAGLEPLEDLDPRVDQDLAAITAKAVDPVATWRYADAGEMHADLQAWLARESVSARPRGPIEALVAFVKRNPREFAVKVVKAACVLIVLLLAVAFWDHYREQALLVEDAEDALDRGDLVLLGRTLDLLDKSYVGPMLMSDELRSVAEQIGQQGQSDPREIRVLLERDLKAEALLKTAEFLHDRKDRYPVLGQFVLGVAGREGEHRTKALEFLARICLEDLDDDPEEYAASELFRDRLVEIFNEEENLTRMDRLLILSALAGCGSPAWLPELIAWVHEQEPGSEEQRLGLCSAAMILHRVKPCLSKDEFPSELYDSFEDAVSAFFDSLTDEPQSRFTLQFNQAAWFLLHAMVIVKDVYPVDLDLVASIIEKYSPLKHHEAAVMTGSWDAQWYLKEGYDTVNRKQLTGTTWGEHCRFYEYCSDYSADVTLMARGKRDRIARQFPGMAMRYGLFGFEDGYESADAEITGRKIRNFMDEESYLIAEKDETPRTVPMKRKGAATSIDALAIWDFYERDALVCGAATGAVCTAAKHDNENSAGRYNYLLFTMPGVSKVELHFELKERVLAREVVLSLFHVRSVRPYIPFCGAPVIRTSLDDGPANISVVRKSGFYNDRDRSDVTNEAHTCFLQLQNLEAGEHRITIELVSSMTEYWLQKVQFGLIKREGEPLHPTFTPKQSF